MPHRDVRYDALYLAFAHRPRPARVRGCPCCVGAAREASLLAAPLRELDAETLGFYAFKAMSTFGREEDFLYFFPRIAELFAGGETLGALCLDILVRKIAEAGEGRLSPAEWTVVREWLVRLWEIATTDEDVWVDRPSEVLAACALMGIDPAPLIERWIASSTPAARRRLAEALIDAAHHSNQGGTLSLDDALIRAHRARPIVLPADLDPELLREASMYLDVPPFR